MVGALDAPSGAFVPYYYYTGYVSDVRLVKGTAVYTANFTPPILPLVSDINTQLLLNAKNATIFDTTGMTDIVTMGGVTVSTSIKKHSPSVSFDGAIGSYLTIVNKPMYKFGTKSFTIECWFRPTTLNSGTIFTNRTVSDTTWGLVLWATSGGVQMYAGSAGAWNIASGSLITTALSANNWYHFALVRDGSNWHSYLDGFQQNWTISSALELYASPTSDLHIGGETDGFHMFTGYIEDFRITNGIARYTSSFVPPTTALPF
jgi:hypothetical protein